MILLQAPLGLTALAALAVPLLLHLLPRKDQRVIVFAAMRFTGERDFPRRQWRLNELLLLAIRLLLIASVALLLAAPVWRGAGKPQAPWVVVAAGIDAAAAHAALRAPDADWRRLSAGFPPLDTPSSPEAPVSSLLRQLDADLPAATPLTVIVPDILGGLDAERVQLGRAAEWHVLPGAAAPDAARAEPGAPVNQPLVIAVRHDAAGTAELPVVRALAAAWAAAGKAVTLDIASSSDPLPDNPGWLIWLGGPLPPSVAAWLRRGGNALASRQALSGEPAVSGEVVLSEEDGTPVLRERLLGEGRILSTPVPLAVGDMPMLSDPGFPQRLFALLAAPILPPDRAAAVDVAPLQREGRFAGPVQPLRGYLASWIGALFLCERLLAIRRRAGP